MLGHARFTDGRSGRIVDVRKGAVKKSWIILLKDLIGDTTVVLKNDVNLTLGGNLSSEVTDTIVGTLTLYILCVNIDNVLGNRGVLVAVLSVIFKALINR